MKSKRLNAMRQIDYIPYIVCALNRMGGKGRASDVYLSVMKQRLGSFRPSDSRKVPSGDRRWKLNCRWARKKMIAMGLIKNNSPRGIWELNYSGIPVGTNIMEMESELSEVPHRCSVEFWLSRIDEAHRTGTKLEEMFREFYPIFGGIPKVKKQPVLFPELL
jgi:hypothetical protein